MSPDLVGEYERGREKKTPSLIDENGKIAKLPSR